MITQLVRSLTLNSNRNIYAGLWTLVPAAGHRRLPAEPRGARAAQREVEVVPQGKIPRLIGLSHSGVIQILSHITQVQIVTIRVIRLIAE